MIALLTDSTSDLTPQAARQYGIHVQPLSVQLGGRHFLDWEEIDPDAVYDHLRQGGQAESAPPPAAALAARYRELLETHEQVVSVHISSDLSETVEHARAAVASLPDPSRVVVVDSRLATAPLAEVVLAAAESRTRGLSAAEIEAVIHRTRQEMLAEFSVATLAYLRRSGRLSRAAELVGNMLNVRPVLHFDDGRFGVLRRTREDQTAQSMLEDLRRKYGSEPVIATIAHAGRDPARISHLHAQLKRSGLNIRQGRIFLLGPVIGVHVGPGTYGVLARPFHG